MTTIFHTLSLWLVVSCLSIASATERLAVLELSGDGAPTLVLQGLSDKIRAGALEATQAGGSELEIMTRESMAVILGDMGLDVACIEGQCEVETARNLRAAYVVSGGMMKLEGQYILTVKLHDSSSGSLLATDEAQNGTLLELRQSAQDTAYRLVLKGLGLTPQSQQQAGGSFTNVQEGRIGGQRASMNLGNRSSSVLIRFESAPTGAVVLVDGTLLCPKTPCTKELSLGSHRVQMQAERYHPREERVNISGDQTVTLSLNPAFGVLKVIADHGDLQVQINGEVGGQGSFDKELPAGRYEVIVESDCLVRTGEVVALLDGETRTVRLSPPKRVAGLDIRAADSEGNAQRGEVFADGVKVGETPGRFEVPLCTSQFSVRLKNRDQWQGRIELVEGKVREQAVTVLSSRTNSNTRTVTSVGISLTELGIEMVPFKAVEKFWMGSSPAMDFQRDPDERLHRGRLDTHFEMSATEVTQAQFLSVMGADPVGTRSRYWGHNPDKNSGDYCRRYGQGGNYPVHCVSWLDAIQFANKLSVKTGLEPVYKIVGDVVHWRKSANGFRLPTETEWAFAARDKGRNRGGGYVAGVGPNDLCDYANVSNNATDREFSRWTKRGVLPCNDGYSSLAPVGTRKSVSGLFDMSGNLWEWVWDGYSEDLGRPGAGGREVGEGFVSSDLWRGSTQTPKVLRGGAWQGPIADYRLANRYSSLPDRHSYFVGFRLARNLDLNERFVTTNELEMTGGLPDSSWVICVGAGDSKESAEEQATQILLNGFAASVIWIPEIASFSGTRMWLIFAGPVLTREDAQALLSQVRQNGYPDAYGLSVNSKGQRKELR